MGVCKFGFVWSSPLIFFSLPFWKTARKTTKKARISSACRTPTILGKEGKNAQNRKEFLEKEKGKENQKEARKRRLGSDLYNDHPWLVLHRVVSEAHSKPQSIVFSCPRWPCQAQQHLLGAQRTTEEKVHRPNGHGIFPWKSFKNPCP